MRTKSRFPPIKLDSETLVLGSIILQLLDKMKESSAFWLSSNPGSGHHGLLFWCCFGFKK